jgi:hypothetical protein
MYTLKSGGSFEREGEKPLLDGSAHGPYHGLFEKCSLFCL